MLTQRIWLIVLALVLVGCGGVGNNSASAPAYDAYEAMPPAATMPPMAAPAMEMEVAGQSAGDMRFAPDMMLNDGSGAIAAAAIERLIIKNGDLALRVEDVPAAIAAVSTLASEAGGFVVSSSTSGLERDLRAYITIRVPAERFETTLNQLEALAVRVLSHSVSGSDVTEEFVDLEARLRNLEATRDRLLDMLNKATRVQDALDVNLALSDVQGQIEQIQGRMRFLSESAAMSTINVSLEPVPVTPVLDEDGWQPIQVARAALRDLLGFGQLLGNALIVLVVWSPVWVLLAFGGWQGMRMMRRKLPQNHQ